MDKKQIQEALEEIALLLELKGENPFKVRAHNNAARTLGAVEQDIAELVQTGELRKIKGIGEGIAKKIEEMVATGHSTTLDKLRAEFPGTIFELFRIPGLGPKRIKALYEQLAISTLGELEYACRENRLVELDGFGATIQQKTLEGIDFVRRHAGRHLIHRALAAAEQLHGFLVTHPRIRRAEVAGSLRRCMDTAKDIDLLAACPHTARAGVAEEFTHLSEVAEVTGSGETKTSVRLISGLAADLRLVTDTEFPYALMHFTGSKDHNVAMRQRAIKRGLKLSEYGLFEGESLVKAKDESEIFKALGLPYIPPELREDRGEIDAAETGGLPVLVTREDIRGVLHVHSTYSDGTNSLNELKEWCRAHGYAYLGVCDHSASAAYAGGLTVDDVARQHDEIDRLNAKDKDFRIFKGIESDIRADGALDYPDAVLARFDFIVASIHSRLNMTQEEATRRIIAAIRNPYTTMIGHLTGRLLLAREGYPLDMNAVLAAAAECGTVIELNASPHRLDIDWRHLKNARDRGIKIAINPDAHALEAIEDIRFGVGAARKGWLRAADVINSFTIAEFEAFLAARRARHGGRP